MRVGAHRWFLTPAEVSGFPAGPCKPYVFAGRLIVCLLSFNFFLPSKGTFPPLYTNNKFGEIMK